MSTQNGIKLAVHIITADFGKLVAQVCECLLRRGKLSVSGIGRFTELPSEKVKQCLRVLIQHNCVHAFSHQQQCDHGESETVTTHYMVLFENIIQRIRFPKFLSIVSSELDKKSAMLLEGLLQHGRLRLAQILERAAQEADAGSDADVDAVRERFFRLVNSRYVESCPAPKQFIGLASEEDNPLSKRRGLKSSKIEFKEAVTEVETNKKAIPGITPQEKKLNLMEVDPEFDVVGCEKELLWRVNFQEFKCLLRNKACVETIRARLDDKAGIVLHAMLTASGSPKSTVSVSVSAVFEELLRSNQALSMKLDDVRIIMNNIGCKYVTDDVYNIDLRNIIEQAQNEEIELIVLKRYGKEAYRIFRLLRTDAQAIETDKISDRTFVEKKVTAKTLYQLWKDNFLLMEKVSVSSTRDILLWETNKDTLLYVVLDELYHAVLNLRLRFNHEADLRRELTQQDKSKLDVEALARFERLQKTTLLLANSILKLDDTILLFQDL